VCIIIICVLDSSERRGLWLQPRYTRASAGTLQMSYSISECRTLSTHVQTSLQTTLIGQSRTLQNVDCLEHARTRRDERSASCSAYLRGFPRFRKPVISSLPPLSLYRRVFAFYLGLVASVHLKLTFGGGSLEGLLRTPSVLLRMSRRVSDGVGKLLGMSSADAAEVPAVTAQRLETPALHPIHLNRHTVGHPERVGMACFMREWERPGYAIVPTRRGPFSFHFRISVFS
jgi:hypothetical protein